MLGSVSGGLGLRKFLEAAGHRVVITSDKDGPGSVFERELPDADVVISQPFWPAYLTAERIERSPLSYLLPEPRADEPERVFGPRPEERTIVAPLEREAEEEPAVVEPAGEELKPEVEPEPEAEQQPEAEAEPEPSRPRRLRSLLRRHEPEPEPAEPSAPRHVCTSNSRVCADGGRWNENPRPKIAPGVP